MERIFPFLLQSQLNSRQRDHGFRKMDNLTYLLRICLPSISFSCLMILARISTTVLNNSSENQYPPLVLDSVEMVSTPLCLKYWWMHISCLPSCLWRILRLCTENLKVFLCHQKMMYFIKRIFSIYSNNHMVFILHLVGVICPVYGCVYVELSLHH